MEISCLKEDFPVLMCLTCIEVFCGLSWDKRLSDMLNMLYESDHICSSLLLFPILLIFMALHTQHVYLHLHI